MLMEDTSQDTPAGHWVKQAQSPDQVLQVHLPMFRKRAGLTQQELAHRMTLAGYKMHQTTIAKIEAGERTVSIGEGFTLAEVLGVDVADLVTHHFTDAEQERKRRRRVDAQIQVRSLEYEVQEQARLMGEARAIYEEAAMRLAAARRDLKQIEADYERQVWQED
jgi:transcriptional regulator with XRE-family HTH domain